MKGFVEGGGVRHFQSPLEEIFPGGQRLQAFHRPAVLGRHDGGNARDLRRVLQRGGRRARLLLLGELRVLLLRLRDVGSLLRPRPEDDRQRDDSDETGQSRY